MTKNEALTVVRESAKFWRAEEIRIRGELTALTDADAVTCDDERTADALGVLGEKAFIEIFNKTYMEGQVRRGYR